MQNLLKSSAKDVELLYFTGYQDYLAQTPNEATEPFLAFAIDHLLNLNSSFKNAHDIICAVNSFYLKQGENKARFSNIKKTINWYKQQEEIVNERLNSPFARNNKTELLSQSETFKQSIHALEEVLIEMNTAH